MFIDQMNFMGLNMENNFLSSSNFGRRFIGVGPGYFKSWMIINNDWRKEWEKIAKDRKINYNFSADKYFTNIQSDADQRVLENVMNDAIEIKKMEQNCNAEIKNELDKDFVQGYKFQDSIRQIGDVPDCGYIFQDGNIVDDKLFFVKSTNNLYFRGFGPNYAPKEKFNLGDDIWIKHKKASGIITLIDTTAKPTLYSVETGYFSTSGTYAEDEIEKIEYVAEPSSPPVKVNKFDKFCAKVNRFTVPFAFTTYVVLLSILFVRIIEENSFLSGLVDKLVKLLA